jgi:outer membrane protein assembly factor BamB
MLHSMYVSNGEEPNPPVRFLPPNANASALTVTGGLAYVVTTHGCGGVENGIWALDLASKQVFSWTSKDAELAGTAGPAFGADGTLYIANTAGSLLALDSKTLVPKDSYTAKGGAFLSSPVVFPYKDKILLAASTKDGRIHLLDAANLGGADHQTPLSVTAAGAAAGALATWAQFDGTRWLLSPTPHAIGAWKVVDREGALSLQSAWTSREMSAPLVPMVINGVVFAAAGGPAAVLYALDGATGKELWNSGGTITTPVRNGTLSGGGSQLYLTTQDGTLYVFGFPIEH